MTYYEELGVECSASPEEIHRAYRRLAQILHPDQHQDEALRRICERQLARLNGIAEVLGDPERRREYDWRLQQECRTLAHGRSRKLISGPSVGAWVWVAAAAAGLALMVLLFRWNAVSGGEALHEAEGSRQPAKAEGENVPAATVARSGDTLAGRLRAMRTPAASADRPQSFQKSFQTRIPAEESDSIPSAAEAPVPDIPETESRPVAQVAPVPRPVAPVAAVPVLEQPAAAPRQQQSYFPGKWFFSQDVSQRDRALYPPEMIELLITEENGVLHGKYRGRYRVADRPVSPDVNFAFAGPTRKAGTIEFTWEGTGGAQGQVRLKAITRVSMEVNWWATRMGALDLTSGTAVLIRAEER